MRNRQGETDPAALPASFYQVAQRYPDREAFIAPDGAVTTFGELGRRVNRLSHGLRALGIEPGERVAAKLDNGISYFELSLAAGQVGVVLTPLNTSLSRVEAEHIVSDSGSRLLLTNAHYAADLHHLAERDGVHALVVGGDVEGWQRWETFAHDLPQSAPDNRVAGNNMGYTSGTSGRPKGVLRAVQHLDPEFYAQQVCAFLRLFGMTEGAYRHLLCSPVYHAAPYAFAWGALHLGHTVVCLAKFDASTVLETIEREHITSTHMVPTHFHRLLALPGDERRSRDVSTLEILAHAGAPCPQETKQHMMDWFGPIIWEYYGATEGTVSVATPADALAKPGTIGRAVFGAFVKILDAEGHEVPPDTEGLIYFQMPGHKPFEYHGDHDKTDASRVGELATVGDIGRVDADGYLFLADRREDMINSGGLNVYPAEVEQRLHSHPSVSDVAVLGQADAEWGQRVVAVVQLVPGTEASDELASQLRQHCREELAGPKCPRTIIFRDLLPRTETGKLLRRVLRDELSTQA